MLTKEEILARKKPSAVQAVELADGTCVFVRVMSGKDRDSYDAGNYTFVGTTPRFTLENARARLAVRCLCDEAGKRLFSDAEAAQVGELDQVFLDQVCDVARRLNKMTRDEEAKESQLFPPAANGASGSDSPATSA